MDGTLVDTEPYWVAAEFALAAAHDAPWTQENALSMIGHDLVDSAIYIRRVMGLDLEPAEIVEYLLDRVTDAITREVPWRPGARELLTDLHERDIPCALVTMSYRRFVEPILARLPDGLFTEVVTGDSVSQGKPHPEPYLKAARGLGVAPERCLAIEDSNTGARSAVAAGCTVLVVPNHVPVLEGERRIFADSLEGLTADTLPGPWDGDGS